MTATAGSFLHLPKGRPHGYVNRSPRPANVLCVFVPGGFEKFFEEGGDPVEDLEQAVASPRPADPVKLEAVARRFGMEVTGGTPSP
jgi:hypothetical protein